MPVSTKNTLRIVAVLLIVALLVPVAFTALTTNKALATDGELRKNAQNVTFISTQGGSTHVYKHAGKLVAVQTDTKRLIWKHDKYRRYMDIDPIGRDRILFVAGEQTGPNEFQRVAVLMNWRNGTELEKFDVPHDTHDIDYLGGHRYAIADKYNNRAYIYNSRTNRTTWEYKFANHYPKSAGGGKTHLNNIALGNNGTSVVLSPRNYDRVIQVDKKTKKTDWTLGHEDDYDILYEQHNPLVLTRDPLTVLVADSENNRIVEYQRSDGEWKLTWGYRGDLLWPRDADRLPNGNTLIGDTLNDRAIEVTPDRKIVWEYHVERSVYDVERLQYGDEPTGPTMASQRDRFDEVMPSKADSELAFLSSFEKSYRKSFQILTWVLPDWVTMREYGFLLSATMLALGWVATESLYVVPLSRLRDATVVDRFAASTTRLPTARLATGVAAAAVLMGLCLIVLLPVSGGQTTLYLGLGLLLLTRGIGTPTLLDEVIPRRIRAAVTVGVYLCSLLGVVGFIALAVTRPDSGLVYAGFAALLLLATVNRAR